MPVKQNLIGKKFNRLLVIDFAPSRNKRTYWKCRCDCGNIIEARADQLKSGNTKSCGCLNNETRSKLGKSHIQDISGQRFGNLIALKRLNYHAKNRGYIWECLCDCGNTSEVCITDLKNGNTTSCGCRKKSMGENNIGIFLLNLNIPFETQKTFPNLKNYLNNRLLKFDFYLPNENILIEFDGPQHYQKTTYTTDGVMTNDQLKNRWSLNNNIPLYRIPYEERDKIIKKKKLSDLCKKEYLVNKIDYYNIGLKI